MGATCSLSGYANANAANITFDAPFSEGYSNHYYALKIESSNAICLKSNKLYVYNYTDTNGSYTNDHYEIGQSTQVQIPTMTPYGQGYVTLRFNKGILVSAM